MLNPNKNYFNTTSVFIKPFLPNLGNYADTYFNTTSVFIKRIYVNNIKYFLDNFNTTSVFIKLNTCQNFNSEIISIQLLFSLNVLIRVAGDMVILISIQLLFSLNLTDAVKNIAQEVFQYNFCFH